MHTADDFAPQTAASPFARSTGSPALTVQNRFEREVDLIVAGSPAAESLRFAVSLYLGAKLHDRGGFEELFCVTLRADSGEEQTVPLMNAEASGWVRLSGSEFFTFERGGDAPDGELIVDGDLTLVADFLADVVEISDEVRARALARACELRGEKAPVLVAFDAVVSSHEPACNAERESTVAGRIDGRHTVSIRLKPGKLAAANGPFSVELRSEHDLVRLWSNGVGDGKFCVQWSPQNKIPDQDCDYSIHIGNHDLGSARLGEDGFVELDVGEDLESIVADIQKPSEEPVCLEFRKQASQ